MVREEKYKLQSPYNLETDKSTLKIVKQILSYLNNIPLHKNDEGYYNTTLKGIKITNSESQSFGAKHIISINE